MSALIGNLQLANPIIHIQQTFHNTKYLQDCRTAWDPYKSDCRPLYQTNIEMLISKWCQNGISNWARWCENEIYIPHRMVKVISAAKLHRPELHQININLTSVAIWGQHLNSDIEIISKFTYLPGFYWCRNKSKSPISQWFYPSCEQLVQRKLAQTL